MSEFRISINTDQSKQAAEALVKMLNDIKSAAMSVDNLSFNTLGKTITNIVNSFSRVKTTVDTVTTSVNQLTQSIQNLAGGVNLDAIKNKFGEVGNAVKNLRNEVTSTNSEISRSSRNPSRVNRGTDTQNFAEMQRIREQQASAARAFEDQSRQQEVAAQFPVTSALRTSQAEAARRIETQARIKELMEQSAMASRVQADLSKLQEQTRQAARTTGLILPLPEFGKFDQALNGIQNNFQTLSNSASQFGRSAETGAQIAARAFYQLSGQLRSFSLQTKELIQIPQRTLTSASDYDPTTGLRKVTQLPQLTESTIAAQQLEAERRRAITNPPLIFPPSFGRSVGAEPLSDVSGPRPFNIENTVSQLRSRMTPQDSQRIAEDYKRNAAAINETGDSFVKTKTKKDALDKNMKDMSSGTIPNFNRNFYLTLTALSLLQGILGTLSFSVIIDQAKQLAEVLADTGQRLERASAFFNLIKDGGNIASEGFRLAQDTAKQFGLEVLPAVEGLSKMQAAAYGTASAGKAVNDAFVGAAAALGATATGATDVTQTYNALSDIIGRQELTGRNLRQLSREIPGFKERIGQALGFEDVQKFIVALNRGEVSISNFFSAFRNAFGGDVFDAARRNTETIIGSVNNLKNSALDLQRNVLEGGFRDALVNAFREIAEVLNKPEIANAVRIFGSLFGETLSVALGLVSGSIKTFAENISFFGALLAGIVTSGILASFAASIFLINQAFAILGVSVAPVLVGISAVAGIIAFLTSKYLSNKEALDDLVKGQEEFKNKQQELAQLPKPGDAAFIGPVQIQVELPTRYEEDIRRITDQVRFFNAEVSSQQTELDLLAQGIRKDSAEFLGLSNAYKFINQQIKEGNVAFKESSAEAEKYKKELVDASVAAASLAAINNKISSNEQLVRSSRNQLQIQRELVALARSGVPNAGLEIEKQFQSVFSQLKDQYADLFKTAGADAVEELTAAFNDQAKALRATSVEASLLANEFKKLTDAQDLDAEIALNKAILEVKNSISETVRVTQQASERDIGRVFRGQDIPSINTSSGNVNTFLRNVEQTAIDRQRQIINGNVQMNITGNVTLNGGNQSFSQNRAATSVSTNSSTRQYDEIINKAGTQYNVDPNLIKAVIRQESAGDRNAVSTKGASGLMQLMPGTAKDLGVTDVKNPEQNIMGGAKYLADQIRAFGGDIKLALAAYNAGPGRVKEYSGIPPFKETQNYVEKVYADYKQMSMQQSPVNTDAEKIEARYRNASITIPSPPTATSTKEQDAAYRAYNQSKMEPLTPAPIPKLEPDVNKGITLPIGVIPLLTNLLRGAGSPAGMALSVIASVKGLPSTPNELSVPRANAYMPGENDPVRTGGTLLTQQQAIERDRIDKIYDSVERARMQNSFAQRPEVKENERVAQLEEAKKRVEEITKRELNTELDARQKQLNANTTLIESVRRIADIKIESGDRTKVEADREISAVRALQEFYKSVGVTQEDIAGKTTRYLEEQARAQNVVTKTLENFDLTNRQAASDFVKGLQDENREINLQIAILSKYGYERKNELEALQARNRAVQEFVQGPELEKILSLIDARKRLKDTYEASNIIQSLRLERQAIAEQSSALSVDAGYRQAELEAIQAKSRALRELGQIPELDRIYAEIDALKEAKKAYEDLNGPIRQYIDSLQGIGNLSNAFQTQMTSLFKATQDTILNFGDVLQKEAARQTDSLKNDRLIKISQERAAAIKDALTFKGEKVSADEMSKRLDNISKSFDAQAQSVNNLSTSFSGLEKVKIFFGTLADSVIDNIKKMTLEMLIFKPLAEEVSNALSGKSGGGFGELFKSIGGIFSGAPKTNPTQYSAPIGPTIQEGASAIIAPAVDQVAASTQATATTALTTAVTGNTTVLSTNTASLQFLATSMDFLGAEITNLSATIATTNFGGAGGSSSGGGVFGSLFGLFGGDKVNTGDPSSAGAYGLTTLGPETLTVYGSTGGLITPFGIQRFSGGGAVKKANALDDYFMLGKIQNFADGGFAQQFASGSFASGTDTVPAMLTPGEIILNKAQQFNVASAMGEKTEKQSNIFHIYIPPGTTEGESRRTGAQIAAEAQTRLDRMAARNGVRRRS